MRKIFVKTLGLGAALVFSSAAFAVGMGGINVTTSLGEPLNADIELLAVSKADRSRMSARLASPDAFKNAGLDYPGALPKLKFQIETRSNGEPYLKVTSSQAVSEPFVSLLVELSWSSGHLLREYTFLLDPPGFKPEQPESAKVQPMEPVTASAPETKAAPPAVAEVKENVTPTVPSSPVAVKAPVASFGKIVESSPAKAETKPDSIKVKRGDTLSKIALETKSADVSLERMLVAMYRVNEDVFDGKNMNRLRTGKILRIPEPDEINKLAQVEAVKEIRAQAADWHAYRMKLASASNAVTVHASNQVSSGKIQTSVSEKIPPVEQAAKEVVRLSKGEAPGDKSAAGGKARSKQDKLHAEEEDATAKLKAVQNGKERIAMLEKNINEMQHLIELKGQVAKSPKTAPDKSEKPEIKTEATSAAVQTSTLATSEVKPAAAKVETSLIDDILDEPLYLAGSVAALLGLGWFGLALTRRSKESQSEEVSSTPHIAAPVISSPDTGDFTSKPPIHLATPAEPEDVDPISEADLFLNFGRDAQAEEILKDALLKNPHNQHNQQIRIKLLSIYASRQEVGSFASLALEVQSSGDSAAWAQTAEMGRKIDPDNPLYRDDVGAAAVGSSDLSTEDNAEHPPASLDFDLDFGESQRPANKLDIPVEPASSSLDFDLGLSTPGEAASERTELASTDLPLSESSDMPSALDFDLGAEIALDSAPKTNSASNPGSALNPDSTHTSSILDELEGFDVASVYPDTSDKNIHKQEPEHAEVSAPAAEDLDFDVTGAPDALAVEPTESTDPVTPPQSDDTMDFPLDFAVHEEVASAVADPAPAKLASPVDLNEINLNLGVPQAAPSEEVRDARWHDVATKLDLARAYQEMGDSSGTREILGEVMVEGNAEQRAMAEAILNQLSA